MLSIEKVDNADSIFNATIELKFDSDSVSTFNLIYLLDNCSSPQSLHPETKQRLIDVFNGTEEQARCGFEDARKAIERVFDGVKFEVIDGALVCHWSKSHSSTFSENWLQTHSYCPRLYEKLQLLPETRPWDAAQFWDLVHERKPYKYDELSENLSGLLEDIFTYGFQLIDDVPVSLEATKEVSEMISIVRPTHYDLGVWDFSSDLAKKDTAYTTLGIDMHTDGNYWQETPGLQLFHLLEHSEGKGGETRIVDVEHVLGVLKDLAAKDESWQETYHILTTQSIAFHQAGEEGTCFMKDWFPILSVNEKGQLLQCRWNNSDRSPQFPDLKFSVGHIYEALFRFNSLINDPNNFVQFQLTPGKVLVFDNWRVLHARNSFTGYRRLCGSYLTRDDFIARLRGFYNDRDALLNAL
ncbi:LAFA_0G15588g1_1 [Lachancea sp. 'fantastica']|nr:LAFA_0G15588g1_1 [Lachancea sp. 'fantastica']